MLHCEYRIQNGTLTLQNKYISQDFGSIESADGRDVTPKSRSLPYSEVLAVRADASKVSFQMWKDLPIIRIMDDSEKKLFSLDGQHWSVRVIRLNAFTDECDTLTEEVRHELIFLGLHKPLHGEIFIFENVLCEESYLLISETPDHAVAEMHLKRSSPQDIFTVGLENGGYPVVLGKCRRGDAEALCRDYFRHANACPALVTMSNTWGDCHSATRVCEAFIEKEIEAAAEIGVDIVQIDDGWQAGNTLYKCQRDERGNRIFDEPFWELNTERFPNGIMPLAERAAHHGIQIGMWFAPSSHHCFAKLERDKAVLHHAYTEYGARFFKLDMYQASDKAHVERMQELLAAIYALGDDVSVQMDVTRYERLNYLCSREYGTIFVENRYTKYTTAYPYKPLKNLWDICRYLPSNRFQFELVNPDLYSEGYPNGDPLAPIHYDMDYLFAGVMLSNPLFWMELQYLSSRRRTELAPLLEVWKTHRALLSRADVCPIGDRPSGVAHTGFYLSLDGKPAYLLTFREYTDRTDGTFTLPAEVHSAELLASNANVSLDVCNYCVSVTYSKARAYAFIKLT